MKFGAWPGLGNTTWPDLLAMFKRLDSTGWDSIWVADHLMSSFEAWTILAALAPHTQNAKLGFLVTGNTFRNPAVVAKMAVNIDVVSNGRLIVGMGAAWEPREHEAYGIPFYTFSERLGRLDEACEILLSLFKNTETDFKGRYYSLAKAPLMPRPIQQPHPPLLVGGGGKGSLRVAAKWANTWNFWGGPAAMKSRIEVLEQCCEEVGRDPAEIEKSANAPLLLSEDKSEIEEASARFGRGAGVWVLGRPMDAEEARQNMLIGSVDQVMERVHEYVEAGVDEVCIPMSASTPVDMVNRFITEVAAHFR